MVINCLLLHQNKVTDSICCPANVYKFSMPLACSESPACPITLGCQAGVTQAGKAWPLNVAWERMGHQGTAPLEGQQTLNADPIKATQPKGKDFTTWPAAASRALEEPQHVCLRGKYPNMSWGGLRHLSFPGEGLWLCGALQTSLGNRDVLEEPTFWPRHFQARGLWWMSELVFSCKWPLWHHHMCINWQVLQEGSWHFQSQQLPKASHPTSQQFGMWSLCLQQQLPDHTILRSLGLCCGTVVSFLST